jgi:hypothetical protein
MYQIMLALKGRYTREFRASLARNKDKLKTEYDIIADELKSKDEKYNEYEQKRMELFREYVVFDNYGNPVRLAPGVYKLKEETADISKKENEKLDIEYKDVIEKRKPELVENDKYLDEEIKIDFDLFKESDIPEELNQDEYELFLNFCEKK